MSKHFFASCVFGWVVGETEDDVLESIRKVYAPEIKRVPFEVQVWSVPLPIEAHYKIDFYRPVVDGIEMIWEGKLGKL